MYTCRKCFDKIKPFVYSPDGFLTVRLKERCDLCLSKDTLVFSIEQDRFYFMSLLKAYLQLLEDYQHDRTSLS